MKSTHQLSRKQQNRTGRLNTPRRRIDSTPAPAWIFDLTRIIEQTAARHAPTPEAAAFESRRARTKLAMLMSDHSAPQSWVEAVRPTAGDIGR